MKRGSIFPYKPCKVANCFQKLLPAFFAVYVSGCHIGDRLDVGPKTRVFFASVVQFQFRGFIDKLRPLVIELTGDRHTNVGEARNPNISVNFRFPDVQERQKPGLAIFPSIFLGEKVSGYRASDSAREKANDYWYCIALHGTVGFFGGIIGSLAYLVYVGEIDLARFWPGRRSKTGPLEKPYPIGGNTSRGVLVPVPI